MILHILSLDGTLRCLYWRPNPATGTPPIIVMSLSLKPQVWALNGVNMQRPGGFISSLFWLTTHHRLLNFVDIFYLIKRCHPSWSWLWDATPCHPLPSHKTQGDILIGQPIKYGNFSNCLLARAGKAQIEVTFIPCSGSSWIMGEDCRDEMGAVSCIESYLGGYLHYAVITHHYSAQ